MAQCIFCYKELSEQEHYHAACCMSFFGTKELPELTLNSELLEELARQTVSKRIALTGVQPKLSVALKNDDNTYRLTIVGLWGDYILKPQHKSIPQMPEVEDLTMHLANLFGINTCKHALLKTTSGELVYLAKRFDRQGGVKIHVEDFCQLGEFQTEQKYNTSYEFCSKIIKKYCSDSALEKVNFFELLIFCFLTGNNDMHLKNFSLMHFDDRIALTPAYDLTNVTLINPKDQEDTALMLNGRRKKINRHHFEMFARSLNLPEKVYERIFKKLLNKNDEVFSLIDRSYLSDEYKEKYKQIWNKKTLLLT